MHVPLLLKADVSSYKPGLHVYSDVVLRNLCSAGLHYLELRVKIGYGLIAATYLATELSILLGCQPFSNNWKIYPNPGSQFHHSSYLIKY